MIIRTPKSAVGNLDIFWPFMLMTRMEVNRRNTTMTAVSVVVIQLCYAVMTVMTAILPEESSRRQKILGAKRKRRDDDDFENAFLLQAAAVGTLNHGFRRFWVDARSTHWLSRLLEGRMLQGAAFDRFFRLSRASFQQLHSTLRKSSLFVISLSVRAIYRETRYSLATCSSFRRARCRIFVVCHARHDPRANRPLLRDRKEHGTKMYPRMYLCHLSTYV